MLVKFKIHLRVILNNLGSYLLCMGGSPHTLNPFFGFDYRLKVYLCKAAPLLTRWQHIHTRVDPTYLANHEELTNEVVEIDLEYMELYDDKALQNRDVAFIKNGAWSPVHYGGASLVKVKSLDSNPSRPNYSKKRPIFGKTDCF